MKRFLLIAVIVLLWGPNQGAAQRVTVRPDDRSFFLTSTTTTEVTLTTTRCRPGAPGCGGVKISDRREYEQRVFATLNLENLSQDMARGAGSYVETLAGLMGCPTALHGDFARLTQEQFGVLFPALDTRPEAMLSGLKRELVRHPNLATACLYVG